MVRRCLPLLLPLLLLAACRKPTPTVTVPADDACFEAIAERFGAQRFLPVALRPMVGPDVFTPELLAAVDDVTRRLEEARTDHTLAVRSLTTLPLMTPGAKGAVLSTIRDQLPLDVPTAAQDRALLMGYENARGDVVGEGGGAAFVHLPADDYAGVDVDALVAEIAAEQAERLMVAVDGTPGTDERIYREVAGLGPAARGVWVVLSAEDASTLKTPELLRALEAFQRRVRALPSVAGAYSVVDDLKLTRRAVHKGQPGAAVLPDRQAEVNQLLTLFAMSGQQEDYGSRLSADGQASVVRFSIGAMAPADPVTVAGTIERFAREGLPAGVDVRTCVE